MKKISFLFIALFITAFSGYSQNSKSVATADEVGKYAFNILKNLDNSSKEQFKNNFLTIEELKEYLNKKNSATLEEFKLEMDQMDNQEYHERVYKVYEKFKEKTKEYKIVWKDIEYTKFTYDEKNEGGLKGIRGKLFFRYKDTDYKVTASAVMIENEYSPVIVRRLKRKDN